jgi:hypothetical protein
LPANQFYQYQNLVSDGESHFIAYSLADVAGVSYSTVIYRLQDSFGMKNFHLRWVPHELTPDLPCRRLETCGPLHMDRKLGVC